MNKSYEAIFTPFRFPSGVTSNNRVTMAPMTLMASQTNGEVTDDELAYYELRSRGIGILFTSSALVSQSGKLRENGFGIDNDNLLPGLKQMASVIQANGTKAIVQLFHGGRISDPALLPGGQALSASAVAAEREGAAIPKAMTEAEIEAVLDDFAQATRRAIEAGFDGVELHGANGFLLQQFFSPHSNRREDEWGGTLEKRMKFPLELIRRVKATVAQHATSPFAVGYRISPEENENPGITMADTLRFVDVLADQGLDFIHVSVDRFWAGPRREESGKSRVVMIREQAGDRVPVIGVGGLWSPEDVTQALDTGVSLVGLGHAMLLNPDWIEKVRDGRESEITTALSRSSQQELKIPDVMWGMITNVPGWFNVVD
ncbi:NADH-dependent flavin oxidoreductase [Paenibacillus glycanilyticus]|uniref:NADH-dependent flavin oxidoreductase YqiG n=1 Tax=Paenibacillus glycanilyticus TaxID=126569 RepID=A0ABQ6GHL2_9BACL|nr:NADH-dependent flavin oxidoreductase [Paenibacillus glycanilyticus]GLX70429.1 putative NADH-dependent flavin oxidoreductase YqiG [Paenibacillus glycanilyticus]